MNKYIVVLESANPPQICLGDKIGNATIVELRHEPIPHRVTASWLAERFNLSRKTIISKIGLYNLGDENKHLYDPKIVIPILENLNLSNQKRMSRRKN